MMIAFTLEGIAILLLRQFGQSPAAFVLLTGLVFFAYGRDLQLVPGDLRRHIRPAIRVGERWIAVCRQGCCVAACSVEQHRRSVGKRLEHGFFYRGNDEFCGGTASGLRSPTVARRRAARVVE